MCCIKLHNYAIENGMPVELEVMGDDHQINDVAQQDHNNGQAHEARRMLIASL